RNLRGISRPRARLPRRRQGPRRPYIRQDFRLELGEHAMTAQASSARTQSDSLHATKLPMDWLHGFNNARRRESFAISHHSLRDERLSDVVAASCRSEWTLLT